MPSSSNRIGYNLTSSPRNFTNNPCCAAATIKGARSGGTAELTIAPGFMDSLCWSQSQRATATGRTYTSRRLDGTMGLRNRGMDTLRRKLLCVQVADWKRKGRYDRPLCVLHQCILCLDCLEVDAGLMGWRRTKNTYLRYPHKQKSFSRPPQRRWPI